MGLLQLAFEDGGESGARKFQEEQAAEILDFVEKWWGKVDLLLIHCEERMSRSPAVAAASAIKGRITHPDDI